MCLSANTFDDQLYWHLGDPQSFSSGPKVSLNVFCKYNSNVLIFNRFQLIYIHGIDMPIRILFSMTKHFCRNFKRVTK